MGFSTIGASIIIFAGLLFVLTTSANAVFEAQREYTTAVQEERVRDEFRRNTDLEILSGGHDGDGTFYLNLTNRGDTVLDLSRTGLVIDGSWSSHLVVAKTIDGRITDLWAPGEVLRIEASSGSEPGRAYFYVETGKGILWTN